MPYSETCHCYFDTSSRNKLLKGFFGDNNLLVKSLEQECDKFCYIAKTGNGKIIKIGVTEKPEKRLFYSIVHFNLKSLRYVAIFPGNFELEKFLLWSFLDEKLDFVKGKRALEWFNNKGKMKEFLSHLDRCTSYSSTKEFYSYF